MKPLWRKVATAGLVAVLMTAGFGCRRQAAQTEGRSEEKVVAVQTVGRGEISLWVECMGEVRPWQAVMLSSRVAGRLEKLGFADADGRWVPLSEGITITQGQVIAQIDLSLYQARYEQMRAALDVAKAQYQDAMREEKRIRALHEEGSATPQMLDKATTAAQIAEAAVRQAESALKIAETDLNEARLRSPITGTVSRKFLDEGNLVNAGTPIVMVEDTRHVKVVASLPERYRPQLVPYVTPVRLRTDILGNQTVTATVSKVYPSVEAATRSVTFEVELDNSDGVWMSGAFVTLSVRVTHLADAIVIPYAAVLWEGKNPYVYVAQGEIARRRPVVVGIREADRCEVVEGLNEGERLIVKGLQGLNDGDRIVISEMASP